jgi:peptidyl-prolyl cis-trans isomerase C
MLKKILLTTFVVSCLSTLSFATEDLKKVVATFDGGSVTYGDVSEEFLKITKYNPSVEAKSFKDLDKSTQENFIKSFATSKILEVAAKAADVQNSEEYKSQLVNLEKQLLQHLYVKNNVDKQISEDLIKTEYESQKKSLENKYEYSASHVLVETEEKAKEVLTKLTKGAKFDKIAQEYSKDEGTKTAGGKLGYFLTDQMVPEFGSAVRGLKKGELSKPVKTSFGYHVIKLEDKRQAKVPTFEEAKGSIVNNLQRAKTQELLESLSAKYKLEVK